jgi:hypothetical protein
MQGLLLLISKTILAKKKAVFVIPPRRRHDKNNAKVKSIMRITASSILGLAECSLLIWPSGGWPGPIIDINGLLEKQGSDVLDP